MYVATTATRKLLGLRKRIRGVAGGTSAGKTIAILQILIDRAQAEHGLIISVVSESMPHIKKGAERDFQNIMRAHNYWRDERWNATDHTYTFETGTKLEFFSTDSPDKVRGPRRDILFVNEANNIPFMAYDQLEVRTRLEVWLDWNPTNEFWWYTELADQEHDFLTLTYKDNEALDPAIVASIESRQHNKNWWRVYGLGQLGETEAQIYSGWKLDLDEIPFEARLARRGLDFGYTNDPSAIPDIYQYNGGLIIDEQLYRKGMSNKQIYDFASNLDKPNTLIIGDSAEPKSLAELRDYGLTILPAEKGQGSVSQGIQYVQDQRISVTKRSVNLIKEYRNYLWKTDKDGRRLNVPEEGFDHLMDALRYAIVSLKPGDEDDELPEYKQVTLSL